MLERKCTVQMSSRSARDPLAAARGLRLAAAAAVLVLAGCSPPGGSSDAGLPGTEWHEFQGTWTAAGARHRIPLGGDRRASIANLEGTLLLAGATRPGVGFRAEAVVLNDSTTGMIGRAVWTDERGDEVFSELRGEGTSSGNRITGTFIGGTGRFSGATGGYELAWQYVLEAEDGKVQGRAVGLTGKVRVGAVQAASAVQGARP